MENPEKEPEIAPSAIIASEPAASVLRTSTIAGSPDGVYTSPNMTSSLGVGVSIQQPGAASEAFVSKMTREHIGQVISQGDAESRRVFIASIVQASVVATVTIVGMLVILALCWMFLVFGKPEFLQGIIGLLIGLLGGGGIGFGVGRATTQKNDRSRS